MSNHRFDPLAHLRPQHPPPRDYHSPAEDTDESAVTADPDQGRRSSPPRTTDMNKLIRYAYTGDPRDR